MVARARTRGEDVSSPVRTSIHRGIGGMMVCVLGEHADGSGAGVCGSGLGLRLQVSDEGQTYRHRVGCDADWRYRNRVRVRRDNGLVRRG